MNRDIITISLSAELNKHFSAAFEQERRYVFLCGSLTEARHRIGNEAYSLIVYNASALSSQDGANATESLRQLTYAPMLVLASDKAIESIMEVGADNCLPTETSHERVIAHARAMLRRYDLYNHYDPTEPDASVLYRGDLMIDPLRHRVTLSGEEIALQRREFRLLLYFARNPGIVLTADQICENVWGAEYNYKVSPVIARLRAKLKDNGRLPKYIETVYGTGYRFLPNE